MKSYLTGINENEALLYLGYKGGDIPPDILAQVKKAEKELLKKALPRVTYRIFDKDESGEIINLGFVPRGNDVANMLKESHRVILFGATLGTEIERYSRRLQVSDLGYAIVFDACANSAIENVCDNFCEEMAEIYGYTTDRFSPGYGDLPFEQQRDFDMVLKLRQSIGVTLSASGLMVPQKSVTAIMGIADKPQEMRFRGCAYCNRFRACTLRKEGRVCGKF